MKPPGKRKYRALVRHGTADALRKAAEICALLDAGVPLAEIHVPPGIIIDPTRQEDEACRREAGATLPLPHGGWRSRIFMSVAMLSRVWKHSKARLGDRLVLLALADFANDAGESWPSVETLAKKSRISERETRYALRRLERSGELKTLPNKGPRGCNVYRIAATEGGQNLQGGNICRGAKSSTGGAVYNTKGGQYPAPEPSIEPSIEPSVPPTPASGGRERSILSQSQEESFAEFWKAYPKKRGKLAAKKAWKTRRPPLPKVLETIAAFQASREWHKDNGQFIPNPSTWINEGRWDDEPPARRQSVL
jgi:Helix-turn-helix domain